MPAELSQIVFGSSLKILQLVDVRLYMEKGS